MADTFTVGIRLVGTRGDLVDVKRLQRDLARVNQTFAKRTKRAFERSVATWDHQPKFQQKTSVSDLTVQVFTVDFIYFLIDGGTSIRYMHMSEDFSPKTRPGSLDSVQGSGGPAYLDTENPLEGIEPRRFAEQVAGLLSSDYEQAVQNAIDGARTSP